jgi:hypothetical protein
VIVTECTPEQAGAWREQFSEGYRVGRGDARWNASPRIPLIDIPPERAGESGAAYVARHYGQAFAIGYTRAYYFETTRIPLPA